MIRGGRLIIELLKIAGVSLLSAVILFFLTKLMGNKQISQLNLFDYVVGITIGSIAAEMATELETPLRPAIAMGVYGLCAIGIALCTNKSNRARAFLAGKPIILMEKGKLSKEKLKKARLDVNEFITLARIAGYFDLSQVETAVFEHNGTVSFLPKDTNRPATPGDLRISVEQQALLYNIIVDGNVMEQELQRTGKDNQWLQKQLREKGFHKPGEVFLGTVNEKGETAFFGL